MNIDNPAPKLMISDDLKGVVDDEQLKNASGMFISIALISEDGEINLTGNLVGVEFSEKPKFDIKITLNDAFEFISNVIINQQHNKKYQSFVMMLGEKLCNIPGPFILHSTKIIEIDPTNKLCILAIDLLRDVL